MAKLELNALVEGISGAVGDELVCRQMPDGSTVMGKRPHFKDRIFSNGQRTHQSRFQQAASYVRLAAKTNPIYGDNSQAHVEDRLQRCPLRLVQPA